jgi:hypothetical protein
MKLTRRQFLKLGRTTSAMLTVGVDLDRTPTPAGLPIPKIRWGKETATVMRNASYSSKHCGPWAWCTSNTRHVYDTPLLLRLWQSRSVEER